MTAGRRTARARVAVAALLCALGAGCGSEAADSALPVFDAGPPLWTPDGGRPARLPWPVLPSGSGRVVTSLRLVTLVQGDDALAPALNALGAALAQSQWWAAVAGAYGLGAPQAAVAVQGPTLYPNSWTPEAVRGYLRGWMADGGLGPDGHTVYAVYFPEGTYYTDPELGVGCRDFPSEHFPLDPDGGALDSVAVLLRCAGVPPDGGFSALDGQTSLTSHEVAEAATDPRLDANVFPFQMKAPWQGELFDALPGTEVGDLCNGSYLREGGTAYQRIWSRAAAAQGADPCIPAQTGPYFNVLPQHRWYAVAPGGTVEIPLLGWAEGARADWLLDVEVLTSTPSGLPVYPSLTGDSTGVDPSTGQVLARINDGRTATLTVTLPGLVDPGMSAVLEVLSIDPAARPFSGAQDYVHTQVVGIFVQ